MSKKGSIDPFAGIHIRISLPWLYESAADWIIKMGGSQINAIALIPTDGGTHLLCSNAEVAAVAVERFRAPICEPYRKGDQAFNILRIPISNPEQVLKEM